eukprot:TRINITY_DN14465_c0_g1_i1.p1 TRINITY_DN14465_c0_g1~~TRINITY_DN14465_c0_g1_i1.p1  ORF type:complete len:389 (-),score=62.08 TRINITY_DN14465_c0_g1_i1:338-1504(-)
MTGQLSLLLEGLPSRSDLQLETDRNEVFGALRQSLRTLLRDNRREAVPDLLSIEHRQAIFEFLLQESLARGLRWRQADELLARLRQSPEWYRGLAIDWETGAVKITMSALRTPNDRKPVYLESAVTMAAVSTGVAVVSETLVIGADSPSYLKGLPTLEQLEDRKANKQDAFQKLRQWVKNARRDGTVGPAGEALDLRYRRRVFDFLPAVACEKSLFQFQAYEVFEHLSSVESWCRDDAAAGIVFPLTQPPPGSNKPSPKTSRQSSQQCSPIQSPRASLKAAPISGPNMDMLDDFVLTIDTTASLSNKDDVGITELFEENMDSFGSFGRTERTAMAKQVSGGSLRVTPPSEPRRPNTSSRYTACKGGEVPGEYMEGLRQSCFWSRVRLQ